MPEKNQQSGSMEKEKPFISVRSDMSKLFQGAVFHSVGRSSGKKYDSVVVQISKPLGGGQFQRQKLRFFTSQVGPLMEVFTKIYNDPKFPKTEKA